jgi:putative Mn2+ efflux pump MntP
MPLIGYLLGSIFADKITMYSHWIAFILLVIIGINMIREAFGEEEKMDSNMGISTMFLLAVATSIDALAVGVSFAFLNVNIIYAVTFIGITTFVCSAAGIKIGSIFGERYKSKAEVCGGVILIFIGLKILLDGLGILG